MEKEKRKEEVKQARKELKQKGIKGFFIKPLKKYWKEKPKEAITIFIKWVLIYYLILTFLQAVNYNFIYCDSSEDQFDGNILNVKNEYVNWVNTYNETQDHSYEVQIGNQTMILGQFANKAQLSKINCTYNITAWKKETLKGNLKNLVLGQIKIMLKLK